LTKPMFFRNEDGAIELLPNPVSSPEELELLWDPGFRKKIGQRDYWYRYFDKHGLNELVRFPYSYYFLKASPFYIKRGYTHRILNRKAYDDLYKRQEATDIMRFIILKFVERARKSGSVPIVVFFPNWKDLVDLEETGSTIYHEFFEEIRRDNHPYTFDATEFFKPHLD
jgi:hypothetical protein